MQDKPSIPLFDIPVDYIAGEVTGAVLDEYGKFPCKIKAGIVAFCVSGTVLATVNLTECDIRAGDVIVLSGGSFLFIHDVSPDARFHFLGFSSAFIDKHPFPWASLVSKASSTLNLFLQLSLTPEQSKILDEAFAVFEKVFATNEYVLPSDIMTTVLTLLMQVLVHLRDDGGDTVRPSDRKAMLYREFYTLVMKHYTSQRKLTFYAGKLGVTLPHLCAVVKSVSGQTASKLLADAIITDAKSQLRSTDLQVKQIAISLGFDNVAFFNKFFKTHVGMTPKTYRDMVF